MIRRLFLHLEQTSTTVLGGTTAFFGIILIRTFFEDITYRTSTSYFSTEFSTLIHYLLFYSVAILGLILILYVATKRDLRLVSVVALFGSPIILLPPIIDLFLFRGEAGNQITYILKDIHGLTVNFFTFYSFQELPGMSTGIKVEFALIFLGVCAYVYTFTLSVLKSILATITSYCWLFFLFTLPSFLALGTQAISKFIFVTQSNSLIQQNFFHPNTRFSDFIWQQEMLANGTMSTVLFFIALPLIITFFAFAAKEKLVAVLKNCRPERLLHYSLLIFFGLWFGSYTTGVLYLNWLSLLSLGCLFLSFWFAWLYAVGYNDCIDITCDEVSNPNRPLITGTLTIADVKTANGIFLTLSLLAGYLAGTIVLYMVILFTALYHVYSAPPLKLKRFLVINPLIIGFCALSAFLAGYYTMTAYKATDSLSLSIMFLVVASYALAANVKDVKDIAGDTLSGVYTIPVVFGERRGKQIISVLIGIAMSLPALILKMPELFLLVPFFGGGAWFLIHQTPFIERRVFLLYFAYLGTLFLVLTF
ncbi:MAG: hypothetical protein RLZZ480_486 [Candidatus Parcubacteria bacterium]|jgi:4-hydroxybenzoate polyprenyltransferase